MVVETIFSSSIFINYILPFLLVFTLVFAILDKTELLGEGKRQINAILGLVIGLMLVAFPYPRGIVVKLIPFLAVAAVILLVFMLLWGFVSGKKGDVLNKGLKITLGIILGLAVLVAVLWASGAWDKIYDSMINSSYVVTIWVNILFVAIIIGAIAAVVATSGKGGGKD